MKLKCMLTSISLLMIISCFSQNRLSGKIFSADTKKPLVGATVFIKETKTGVATDSEGNYSILLSKGNYNVEVSFIGYKTIKKTIKITMSEIHQNFYLQPSTQSLNEIVISAKSKIQEKREAPETITIIDAKEIRGRAVSLESVLDKAAGIKIRSSGGMGSASRVMIHGLEGKRIQIFVDGSPLNSPDGSFTMDDIPIDLIERIEVYKGIVPARFGGDGLGGAVNIVIREFEKDYIDVSYEHSTYNTHRANWVFKKCFDKFGGLQIGTGGFYNYSNNNYSFKSPYQDNLTITRDHDQFSSGLAGVAFTFTKLWFDEIAAEFMYFKNHKEIQGIQKNIQHAQVNSDAFIIEGKLKKEGFFHKNLDFEYNLTIPLASIQFTDTSSYNYDFNGNRYLSPSGQGEMGTNPNNSNNKLNEHRHRLNLNYKFNDKHNINLNSNFRHSKMQPEDELASQFVGYNIAGYPNSMYSIITGLSYEAKFNDKKLVNFLSAKIFHLNSNIFGTGADGGALLEEPEIKENTFTNYGISEAIRWRIFPSFNIKASVQRALRLPTSDELFGNGIAITPAPELKPEKSNNINLGFLFDRHKTLGLERMQLEGNFFYMDIEDMIQLLPSAMAMGYVNLGEVEIKGIDAELKLDITKNIYAYGNITYQNVIDVMEFSPGTIAENPTKGLRVPNVPYFYYNFGAEYHIEDLFGEGQFSRIYWDSRYTKEFFYNWEMSIHQNRRIPSSFIHDLGIQQSFANNRYIISAEIHNITNQEVWGIYQMPLMGRTFHIKLRYSFVGD